MTRPSGRGRWAIRDYQSLANRPGTAGSGTESGWDVKSASSPELFLSVVVPAKNEAASLPQLVHEITQSLHALCEPAQTSGQRSAAGFEIIVVDDGSTDETTRVLADLTAVHPQLRSLRLATSGAISGPCGGLQSRPR